MLMLFLDMKIQVLPVKILFHVSARECLPRPRENLFCEVLAYRMPDALTGKVISADDGDTVTILDYSNRQHKIHLFLIYLSRIMMHSAI